MDESNIVANGDCNELQCRRSGDVIVFGLLSSRHGAFDAALLEHFLCQSLCSCYVYIDVAAVICQHRMSLLSERFRAKLSKFRRSLSGLIPVAQVVAVES